MCSVDTDVSEIFENAVKNSEARNGQLAVALQFLWEYGTVQECEAASTALVALEAVRTQGAVQEMIRGLVELDNPVFAFLIVKGSDIEERMRASCKNSDWFCGLAIENVLAAVKQNAGKRPLTPGGQQSGRSSPVPELLSAKSSGRIAYPTASCVRVLRRAKIDLAIIIEFRSLDAQLSLGEPWQDKSTLLIDTFVDDPHRVEMLKKSLSKYNLASRLETHKDGGGFQMYVTLPILG